jgi:hypothetical protein
MLNAYKIVQESSPATFDLFRLTKSKEVVDICPNTIRAFAKKGLRIYRAGKPAFVSRSELLAFIKTQSA